MLRYVCLAVHMYTGDLCRSPQTGNLYEYHFITNMETSDRHQKAAYSNMSSRDVLKKAASTKFLTFLEDV